MYVGMYKTETENCNVAIYLIPKCGSEIQQEGCYHYTSNYK